MRFHLSLPSIDVCLRLQRLTRKNLLTFLCRSTVLLILSGCGSSNETTTVVELPTGNNFVPKPIQSGLPVPNNRRGSQFNVLFIGNSHVTSNDLPAIVHRLIKTGRPDADVYTALTLRWAFLDERLEDNMTDALLHQRQWSHVILQGQKYSTSGLLYYPIDAAVYWVARTKTQGATPILFPEHPREGNSEEGERVYLLHQSINAIEPACVAPIPLAWFSYHWRWPDHFLHEDGNHANLAGSFLTALIFYQVITGESAELLPYIPDIAVSQYQQSLMRQQAAATLREAPACPYDKN